MFWIKSYFIWGWLSLHLNQAGLNQLFYTRISPLYPPPPRASLVPSVVIVVVPWEVIFLHAIQAYRFLNSRIMLQGWLLSKGSRKQIDLPRLQWQLLVKSYAYGDHHHGCITLSHHATATHSVVLILSSLSDRDSVVCFLWIFCRSSNTCHITLPLGIVIFRTLFLAICWTVFLACSIHSKLTFFFLQNAR